jgi:hypothetical protein
MFGRRMQMAQKSANWLVNCTLKYVRNFFTTYQIYTSSKCDPPYSMHNSQRCDTVLQVDWQV